LSPRDGDVLWAQQKGFDACNTLCSNSGHDTSATATVLAAHMCHASVPAVASCRHTKVEV
jgi:hypothetical protein